MATLAVSLALIVFATWFPLGDIRGRNRARDSLQIEVADRSNSSLHNVGVSTLLFGLPLILATAAFLASLGKQSALTGVWLFLVVAVISGVACYGAFWRVARRRLDFFSSIHAYLLLLVPTVGIGLLLVIGSLRLLPPSTEASRDWVVIGMVEVLWLAAASHVAFAPSAALAVTATVRVLRIVVVSVVFLSAIPVFAAEAGSIALRAIGLGGGIPVRLSLDSSEQGGAASQPVAQRYRLTLDAGEQLYLRGCHEPTREFAPVPWAQVRAMEILRPETCDAPNEPTGSRGATPASHERDGV